MPLEELLACHSTAARLTVTPFQCNKLIKIKRIKITNNNMYLKNNDGKHTAKRKEE